ncbi:MAG: ABC transporter permease [Ignavibacteria bacterium]|nr:ABC transporter permease [Ignavibacteria bacterium]MBI3766101.1 ABC transporter permease [Ignavibacteriales bacterium]
MKIPLTYTLKSLWTRKLTTTLTIGGISMVVFVFAAVLMLAYGVEKTLIETGSDENVIVIRKAAQAELQSQIDRDAANIIKTLPELAATPDGKPFAANELFVLINIFKKGSGDMGNVTVRGITSESMLLRPQIKILEGKMFTAGTSEIIVGSSIAKRFQGCTIGERLKFGGNYWTIVGVFDGNGTGFDSEIWGDVEQMLPAFGRPVFSSLTFRLKNQSDFDALKTKIESDRRLNYLEIQHEKEYYAEQSRLMAIFIRVIGTVVSIIFSFGATIGAMITMYAAVANRTVEIGTLRSLGFRRRNILAAFLIESVLIASLGAAIGLFTASFLQLFVISTVNFGTFSELAFGFTLSLAVIKYTAIFALGIGFIGGFLPAVRAARLNIVNALRAS